jgi:hypothetical protein
MQQQQQEWRAVLSQECEQCRVLCQQQPRNAKLFGHYGAMLLQLAVITDEAPAQQELLRESREKLQRALDIDTDCIVPDGQLCQFHVW